MSRPRVVCLVGPTAAGKTALALALAEHVGGEIVSADSRQVYRRLDIGTAKPTHAEQQRIRHHCLDLVEPTESFDAARYRAAAAAAIADVTGRVSGCGPSCAGSVRRPPACQRCAPSWTPSPHVTERPRSMRGSRRSTP
jgi:IPP transferase